MSVVVLEGLVRVLFVLFVTYPAMAVILTTTFTTTLTTTLSLSTGMFAGGRGV